MKNIELKVLLDNFTEIINILKGIEAKFKEQMHQIDIYYNCKNARVKIRKIDNKKFFLIFYQRPNKYGSKISKCQTLNIKKSQLETLKYIFQEMFGEKIIVNKIRKVYLYKNTQIHLDQVKNLGNFLELETVVRKNNIKIAKKEHNYLIKYLGLNRYKNHNKSYSDLLINK